MSATPSECGDGRRGGARLRRVERQETRRRAPGALEKCARGGARGDDQFPRASSTAPEFLAGVDYIVGVHDGVAPGELFLSAGTQAGVVGVFPLVQGPSHARGTADFITLAPPVAVLRHGHRDIVRCVAWDANARASEPSRVPLTCGVEDSLVCCAWTPGTNDDAAPPRLPSIARVLRVVDTHRID